MSPRRNELVIITVLTAPLNRLFPPGDVESLADSSWNASTDSLIENDMTLLVRASDLRRDDFGVSGAFVSTVADSDGC